MKTTITFTILASFLFGIAFALLTTSPVEVQVTKAVIVAAPCRETPTRAL